MNQPIEIPQECNSLEILCLTDSGVWLPAAIVKLDVGIDQSFYAEPLRFRARPVNVDYSKVKCANDTP